MIAAEPHLSHRQINSEITIDNIAHNNPGALSNCPAR
jgi:hypothetical protein